MNTYKLLPKQKDKLCNLCNRPIKRNNSFDEYHKVCRDKHYANYKQRKKAYEIERQSNESLLRQVNYELMRIRMQTKSQEEYSNYLFKHGWKQVRYTKAID